MRIRPAATVQERKQRLRDDLTEMKQVRADLVAELRKLPARVSRNAAQKRDALIMRAIVVTLRTQLNQAGQADDADLDDTNAQ